MIHVDPRSVYYRYTSPDNVPVWTGVADSSQICFPPKLKYFPEGPTEMIGKRKHLTNEYAHI